MSRAKPGKDTRKRSNLCPKCRAEGRDVPRQEGQSYCHEHVANYGRERRARERATMSGLRDSVAALTQAASSMQRELAEVRLRLTSLEHRMDHAVYVPQAKQKG